MVKVTAPPKTKKSKSRRVILGLEPDAFLSVFWVEDLAFFALFLEDLEFVLDSELSTGAGTPDGVGIAPGGATTAGGATAGVGGTGWPTGGAIGVGGGEGRVGGGVPSAGTGSGGAGCEDIGTAGAGLGAATLSLGGAPEPPGILSFKLGPGWGGGGVVAILKNQSAGEFLAIMSDNSSGSVSLRSFPLIDKSSIVFRSVSVMRP